MGHKEKRSQVSGKETGREGHGLMGKGEREIRNVGENNQNALQICMKLSVN